LIWFCGCLNITAFSNCYLQCTYRALHISPGERFEGDRVSSSHSGRQGELTMPTAVAMSESTLLGLQSSIGVALANSLEVHRKEEALVRLRSCRACLYLFTAVIGRRSKVVYTQEHDTEVDLIGYLPRCTYCSAGPRNHNTLTASSNGCRSCIGRTSRHTARFCWKLGLMKYFILLQRSTLAAIGAPSRYSMLRPCK